MLGGVAGAALGISIGLLVLLPVLVLFDPLVNLLLPLVAGAVAGATAYRVGERMMGDESRGRPAPIVFATILAAVLYGWAVLAAAVWTDWHLPPAVAGYPVGWIFFLAVGSVASMATQVFRRDPEREPRESGPPVHGQASRGSRVVERAKSLVAQQDRSVLWAGAFGIAMLLYFGFLALLGA